MKQIDVKITGIRCAGCVMGIENSLSHLTGIKKASVSLTRQIVEVWFDPDAIHITDVIDAIKKLGYKAEVLV